MSSGAEWVGLDAVENSLNDLPSHDSCNIRVVFETSSLEDRDTDKSEELNCSHSVNTESVNSLLSLVLEYGCLTVKIWLRSDNNDTDVDDVFEVRVDLLECLVLVIVLEEVGVLLSKLS